MRGSEKSVEEQAEPIDPSFTILDSKLKPFEFLSTNLPLTPHQIGIGQEITLMSSTPHAYSRHP